MACENYDCPRCGYTTQKVAYFREHLNRKYICSPKVADVSLDALKTQYIRDVANKFICDSCQKGFNSRTGFFRHKKVCYLDLSSKSNTELLTDSIKIQSNMLHTLNQILKVLSKQELVPIQIKDFGQEDIMYLLNNDQLMKTIFTKYEAGILKFIELVWFDKQHPENMNIKSIEYYQSNEWHKDNINNIVTKLIDYIGCYFQMFLEKNPIFDKTFLDTYMKQIGAPLEWDLSHDDYDYNSSSIDTHAQNKIFQAIKILLLKKQ
jgi:hypothetical protein